MDDIVSYITEHSDEYGSIPFWSWNDRLVPSHLCEQIDDMKAIGMKGFFMHARSGLETEYLGEEWYDCVRASVARAKELGMEAWAYDENGWPSGFAGGKLLTCDENYAHFLKYKLLDSFDCGAFGVWVCEGGQIRRVLAPVDGCREYHTIYRHADESYVDTLNAEVTKKFIKLTHKDYKSRLGGDFGKAMPGFFTDEPQYYRWATVWSDILPEKFAQRFGYDVMERLPALFIDFEGAREFRYDYHLICHELFIDGFIKLIYDWCRENGAQITGHAVEEKYLSGQMWCCGGIMPFYEYMSIPGVDYLGKGVGNDVSSKQVGSVAAQLGKKRVLSEMFACCGWEVTPLELKQIAEHQYFGGVNLMCQHLYPYSERGQRKRDYPAHYSEHLPWHGDLTEFNKYFNRLGCVLSIGSEKANILVIHPIHSAYLDYKREEDQKTILPLEDGLARVTDCLSQNQMAYHYGDEKIMARHARVEGSRLIVGNASYDTVVLPLLYTIDSSTAALLREFLANGGKLCSYSGTLPDRIDGRIADMSWLVPNITLGEVCDASDIRVRMDGSEVTSIRVMIRETGEGRIFYILNLGKTPLNNVNITVRGCSALSRIDLDNPAYTGIDGTLNGADFEFTLDFESVQSYILVEKKAPVPEKKTVPEMHIDGVKLLSHTENSMPLDYARLSFDGVSWGERAPVMQIKDNLLKQRYKGDVWMRFEFNSDYIPGELAVVLEPMNYKSITLNDTELAPSGEHKLDRSFLVCRAGGMLRRGMNTLTVCFDYFQSDYVYHVLYDGVSESLRNCLCFDCEVEIPYLMGDFCVRCDGGFDEQKHEYYIYDGDFTLEAPHAPTDWHNTLAGGYPFFNGTFDIELSHNGKGGILSLPGSYPTAEVFVNDVSAGLLMFSRHIDLSGLVCSAQDRVVVRLKAGNRNLLGPHHWVDCECYASPDAFSFEGKWDGDRCDNYRHTYSFKRLGLDL